MGTPGAAAPEDGHSYNPPTRAAHITLQPLLHLHLQPLQPRMASSQKLVGSLVGRLGHMRGAAVQEARWTPQGVVGELVAPLPRERWNSTDSSCSSDSIGPLC